MQACKKVLTIHEKWYSCPEKIITVGSRQNKVNKRKARYGLNHGVMAGPAESVFLDEGQGASFGASYFANFSINLDQ